MIEVWRRWTYKRYEARVAAADDFAQFEQWASGPWTPQIAAKMPWDKLIKGPQLGNIDAETRKVIDLEIEKRHRSRQPLFANVISLAALIVAIFAFFKSS